MNFDFSEDQDITNFITAPRSNKIATNRSQPKPAPNRNKPAPIEDHYDFNKSDPLDLKANTFADPSTLDVVVVKSNRKTLPVKSEVNLSSKPKPSTLRNTSSKPPVSKPTVPRTNDQRSNDQNSDFRTDFSPDFKSDFSSDEPELNDIPVQLNRRPKPASSAAPKPTSSAPRKPANSVPKTNATTQTIQEPSTKPTIGGQPEPSYVYFIRQINNAKTEKVPFRVGYAFNVAQERERLEQSALYKMLTYKVVKCVRGDAIKVCEDFTARMSTALIRNSWYNISKEEIDNFVSILCISSDYTICTEAKAK